MNIFTDSSEQILLKIVDSYNFYVNKNIFYTLYNWLLQKLPFIKKIILEIKIMK
jgi:hypothetical protein